MMKSVLIIMHLLMLTVKAPVVYLLLCFTSVIGLFSEVHASLQITVLILTSHTVDQLYYDVAKFFILDF